MLLRRSGKHMGLLSVRSIKPAHAKFRTQRTLRRYAKLMSFVIALMMIQPSASAVKASAFAH